MTSTRIAYVINSLEGGGAALPVPAVIEVMRKAGAEVEVFALSRRDGRAAVALADAGIAYHVCEVGKSDHLRAAMWLWRRLARFRPTVIWTSLTQATIIGQLIGLVLRIPVISWQHNAYLKPANRRLLTLTRRLTRLWVADSEAIAGLTHVELGIASDDITVWPLFRADPGAPRARPCDDGEIFTFGSLGRLHPNKGYDILVHALARLSAISPALVPRLRVVIAGEGEERDRLIGLSHELGVTNLVLAGYQSDPRNFLSQLHGYLQPSRAEGLCIAAHEAMQAGLPTIVSAIGEMQHSVEHLRTGLVILPDDPAALADAIWRIAEDPASAYTMGSIAREHVLERFGADRFAQAGEAIMNRVMAWQNRVNPGKGT